MSFSKVVKDEIIKKNLFKKQSKSLLQGLFLSAGSLKISEGKLSFTISNENENVINFTKKVIAARYDFDDLSIVKVVKSFKSKERFELTTADPSMNKKILIDLGIITEKNNGTELSSLSMSDFSGQDAEQAFLTGMFLGCGTVSKPSEDEEKRRYGYHFEFVLSSEIEADLVSEMLAHFDIFPKQICRGEQFVVYLKNSEVICDTLSLFGASKSLLDILNEKVNRDINNTTNRQINCYSANVDKTMNAAVKQMMAISVIQNTIGIENLPDNLAEAALARLSNPEASLKDLLNVLESKISKGALAQRFNKIIEIAQNLGEDDEK